MWIKRGVVMLPTNEKANGVLYLDDTQSGKLFISKAGNRHLYILSDEEIKEDDWVLYTNPNFKRSFIVKISDINHDKFDYKRETLDIREIPISWAKKSLLLLISLYLQEYIKEKQLMSHIQKSLEMVFYHNHLNHSFKNM